MIDRLRNERLVERVAERGPTLLAELREALSGSDIVGEVRGHGFLLGIDYADPRDGRSFLDPALDVARSIDREALDRACSCTRPSPPRTGTRATRR